MLYLVATPIGNLNDITLRALSTLREADIIASEDTRKTGLLLKHFAISKPQIAFHEHNEQQAGQHLENLLRQGKSIALVTNAGTPGISDPGYTLVRRAINARIDVLGDREAAIANDLTKMFELVQRGTISSLVQWVEQQSKLKGEFIVVIAGAVKEERKGKVET